MSLKAIDAQRDEELAGRGLPAVAYIDNSHGASAGATPVVAIKRGQAGYHPVFTALTADDLNTAAGVTPAQREAMRIGSTLGWHVPGAHPAALAGFNTDA